MKFGLPREFRIVSARIERAEFPVHKNRTLYDVFIFFVPSGAAGGTDDIRVRRGFGCADERAHEFAIDERCDFVDVESG